MQICIMFLMVGIIIMAISSMELWTNFTTLNHKSLIAYAGAFIAGALLFYLDTMLLLTKVLGEEVSHTITLTF